MRKLGWFRMKTNSSPLVSIIMGSESDLPVMKESAELLEKFGVSYELTIVSAHRTPERLVRYSQEAKTRGIRVIIAGAGGASHLPGMTASFSHLPVIGVPIKSKKLNGLDSLLSIAQMPDGVPVATVAINGAKNAGLLALEILALSDKRLEKKLLSFRKKMSGSVLQKAKSLEKMGFKKYLQEFKAK